MILIDELKILDDNIKVTQYDLGRAAAKISAISPKDLTNTNI